MRRPTEKFARPVSYERGDLGLMHAENFGNLNLCQAATLQDRVDLQGWLRLEHLLLGVAKVEVCKRRFLFPRLREPWFFRFNSAFVDSRAGLPQAGVLRRTGVHATAHS